MNRCFHPRHAIAISSSFIASPLLEHRAHLVLWHFGKFGQVRIHIVPWLRAGYIDVRLGAKPARIVETARHNVQDVGRRSWLTEQPGAAILAEPTTDDSAAIAG